MKTRQFVPLLLSLFLGACAGSKTSDGISLDDCPVVTTQQKVGGDLVTVLHLDLVKDTLDLPLSSLLEDFRIVPLDNRNEALTKGSSVSAYDNYIGIGGSSQEAYKLFDKEGRFLCQVGANGQGPGEYLAVYDNYVDEANDRVYLLPWNAKSVLVYNLKGEYLSSIPLPTLVPKGVFSVDTAKRLLTVGLLPFADIEAASVVWQQDFDGNVIHRVDASPYALAPDYSNEVSSYLNCGSGVFDFSIFHWAAAADTLYHFLPEENRLAPVLTLQQSEEKIQQGYAELPGYYMVDIPTGYTDTEHGSYVSQRVYVLIDKETQKGAFVRILNDLIGNEPIEYAFFYFKNGYFAYTMEPEVLLESLEKALAHPESLNEEQRGKLEKLKNSIHENDNNYLFVGKIKQKAELSGLEKMKQLPAVQQQEKTQTELATLEEKASVVEEPIDTVLWNTPYIKDWKEYYRANNRFKDWDPDKKTMALVIGIIEKDGTPRNLRIGRSSGNEKLDQEAIRLIKEAKIEPALNKAKQPVRCSNFGVAVAFPPL